MTIVRVGTGLVRGKSGSSNWEPSGPPTHSGRWAGGGGTRDPAALCPPRRSQGRRALPPCCRASPEPLPLLPARARPPHDAYPSRPRARAFRHPSCSARARRLAEACGGRGAALTLSGMQAGPAASAVSTASAVGAPPPPPPPPPYLLPGSYENSQQWAARDLPCAQRAAAGVAGAETCAAVVLSPASAPPEPVSAPPPSARPAAVRASDLQPLGRGFPAHLPPSAVFPSSPATASLWGERGRSDPCPPRSAPWDPSSPHLTGCVTRVFGDGSDLEGNPDGWGFGCSLEKCSPQPHPPPADARSPPPESLRRVPCAVSGQRRPQLPALSPGCRRRSLPCRAEPRSCWPGAGARPSSPPALAPHPLGVRFSGGGLCVCVVTAAMVRFASSEWMVWPEVCSLFTT